MSKSRQMLSVRAQVGVVAANIAVILVVLSAAAAVPTSPFVAVVVAPWSASETVVRVVAAAQGSLVAPGRFGWIVIAHSQDREFASRLRQAGAWFVLDHKALSACLQRR
jgi:hypothetical protein